jgi:pyruvate kinase
VSFPRIVCTLGTTTDDPAVMAAMAAAGMGLARINTAYARPDELERRIDLARAAGVPALLDLKGPQLRVEGTTDRVDPATGRTVTVPCRYPIAAGDVISVGFGVGPVRFAHDLAAALAPGDEVLFENGTIRTRVVTPADVGLAPPERAVLLQVEDAGGGKMLPGMSASVPGRRLDLPRLSRRDEAALVLGRAHQVGWYALSFVRDAEDVAHLDRALGGDRAGLVPKIEDAAGVEQLEAIVAAVRAAGRPCAVMIARGDLFVELPRAKLFAVQDDLIRRCRALDVPAIVATGLLLSMQTARAPTRAEVCDVAAAARAGAASFLLSDETASGHAPAAVVATLAELLREYPQPGS